MAPPHCRLGASHVREYDLIADWYAAERIDDTGVPEAQQLAASLAPSALVLDAGCGNGVPLTRALLNAGHRVVGLDSSAGMLRRFHTNVTAAGAVRGVLETLPFAECTFDGAIAWGVMFHLTQDRQRAAMGSLARVLKPAAPFLFTAGDVDGRERHVGQMNGVDLPYYSFTIDGYRQILAEHGCTLVRYHTDKGGNGYYLARKDG